jgi:hypothetical protein
MLNEKEQEEFYELVDGVDEEGFTQMGAFCEEATLYGVKLALDVVHGEASARKKALGYLFLYSHWHDFQLNAADRTLLEKWEEYGEDEE